MGLYKAAAVHVLPCLGWVDGVWRGPLRGCQDGQGLHKGSRECEIQHLTKKKKFFFLWIKEKAAVTSPQTKLFGLGNFCYKQPIFAWLAFFFKPYFVNCIFHADLAFVLRKNQSLLIFPGDLPSPASLLGTMPVGPTIPISKIQSLSIDYLHRLKAQNSQFI